MTMPSETGTVLVRLADHKALRLFAWELRRIGEEMKSEGCRHGIPLADAVDRFLGSQPDEELEDSDE